MADQVTDCLLSLPSAVLVGIRVCARPPCREPGHCWESDTLTAAPALLELPLGPTSGQLQTSTQGGPRQRVEESLTMGRSGGREEGDRAPPRAVAGGMQTRQRGLWGCVSRQHLLGRQRLLGAFFSSFY